MHEGKQNQPDHAVSEQYLEARRFVIQWPPRIAALRLLASTLRLNGAIPCFDPAGTNFVEHKVRLLQRDMQPRTAGVRAFARTRRRRSTNGHANCFIRIAAWSGRNAVTGSWNGSAGVCRAKNVQAFVAIPLRQGTLLRGANEIGIVQPSDNTSKSSLRAELRSREGIADAASRDGCAGSRRQSVPEGGSTAGW